MLARDKLCVPQGRLKSSSNSLGLKWLAMSSALAYNVSITITSVKSFIVLAQGSHNFLPQDSQYQLYLGRVL
jgi:hypothetical protein